MINKILFSVLTITSVLFLTGCKKKDSDCQDHCTNICQAVDYCEKTSDCKNGQCSINNKNTDQNIINLENDEDYISNDQLIEAIEETENK